MISALAVISITVVQIYKSAWCGWRGSPSADNSGTGHAADACFFL